ncbi:MAG: glutamate--cysteine ligase [Rubrobacteraceae bacterium]
MATKAEEYTLGVEEEYQIVGGDGGLIPENESVMGAARETLGEQVELEMLAAQIEVMTPVCSTLSEVRSELSRLRRGIIAAAEDQGKRILAASTHPFSHWNEQELTPKGRYRRMMESFQRLGEQQLSFGFHVHVGLDDREAAVAVMDRIRVWLAPLLALSANSPFWLGEDSGYASYRTQIWGRFPTAGPPAFYGSLETHDLLMQALVETGSVIDSESIYFDVRLPQKHDTVEIRVADVCSKLDESVMLAGLSRALVRECHGRFLRGEPAPDARPELLRAAHWRASRHGLDEELVDLEGCRSVPAREIVGSLLDFARPALEEEGDWDEVSTLVEETLESGNGARRQRRAYEQSGELEAVVDALVAETAEGVRRGT